PFQSGGAACRSGTSPALGAAGEACVGTVACVATPADTRGGLQPLATTPHPSPSQGAPRPKRAVVTATPPSTVAELAHARPTTCWYRRTVSAGTKGPMTYECARQRILRSQDGEPTPAVWWRSPRPLGVRPSGCLSGAVACDGLWR